MMPIKTLEMIDRHSKNFKGFYEKEALKQIRLMVLYEYMVQNKQIIKN